MITLTPTAVEKAKEYVAILGAAGLRVGVQGGGCSGFSYNMVAVLEAEINPDWNLFEFDTLRVYVDQMSAMYLEGTQIDYVDGLNGTGFKFNNPRVKSTCGCGQSFSV
jgi:iron-sulfur cluster assembly accessory protein